MLALSCWPDILSEAKDLCSLQAASRVPMVAEVLRFAQDDKTRTPAVPVRVINI